MSNRSVSDASRMWLATMRPTAWQRRITLAAIAVVAAGFLVAAPFAQRPLPRSDGFIPAVQAIIFVTDLLTAVLLFNQFSVVRSLALLVLASGYLFSGLMVIPHTLSFPGALAPDGLIGGLQTTGWLHIVWHFGFPAAVIGYAVLKDQKAPAGRIAAPPARMIGGAVIGVASVVMVLSLALAAGDAYLPRLFVNRTTFSPLVFYTGLFDTIVAAAALFLLWRDQQSVLGQWLMVAVFATTAEMVMVTWFSAGRFDVGWYSVRMFSVISSTVVLIALLAESTRLYERLSHTILRLQHERDSKLLNVEAIGAVFAHELKQPLSTIALEGAAGLLFLERPRPDLGQAREALNAVVEACNRSGRIIESIQSLTKPQEDVFQPVDLKLIVLEALNLLRGELNERQIVVRTELASMLPTVEGHPGQLLQVIVNLIHNAIEAMASLTGRERVLTVQTEGNGEHAAVMVGDTGPGIDPHVLSKIFDPFVTTKPLGTGLGLALSRTIVDRHGGKILVSSEIGKGTRFRLVLPGRADRLVARISGAAPAVAH